MAHAADHSSASPLAERSRAARPTTWPLWLLVCAWLALAAVPARAAAAENTAGLVVRHGDGRIVSAVVTFTEPQITGLELLRRSGLRLETAPFGPGIGVCSLDGEGCPATDCFCKSYGNPSVYWRYYVLRNGKLVYSNLGPSQRPVAAGDVDAWDWSGGSAPPPLPDLPGLSQPTAPAATTVPPPPSATATVATATPTARTQPTGATVVVAPPRATAPVATLTPLAPAALTSATPAPTVSATVSPTNPDTLALGPSATVPPPGATSVATAVAPTNAPTPVAGETATTPWQDGGLMSTGGLLVGIGAYAVWSVWRARGRRQ